MTPTNIKFDRVSIPDVMSERKSSGYKPIDTFEWWWKDVKDTKPGQFDVIMIDTISEIEDGLTEWVQKGLNFDFNTSATPTEKDLDKGRDLPKGKYVAVVENIEKDHGGKTPAYKFTFAVHAGPYKGRKVFERLFLSEKANNRVVLFGNRLGLIAEKELGKESVRKSWKDAIGKTVVIDVENREYDDKDGNKKTATNLTFNGIYKLDDPKVADVVKAAGAGQAAGAGGNGGSSAARETQSKTRRGHLRSGCEARP